MHPGTQAGTDAWPLPTPLARHLTRMACRSRRWWRCWWRGSGGRRPGRRPAGRRRCCPWCAARWAPGTRPTAVWTRPGRLTGMQPPPLFPGGIIQRTFFPVFSTSVIVHITGMDLSMLVDWRGIGRRAVSRGCVHMGGCTCDCACVCTCAECDTEKGPATRAFRQSGSGRLGEGEAAAAGGAGTRGARRSARGCCWGAWPPPSPAAASPSPPPSARTSPWMRLPRRGPRPAPRCFPDAGLRWQSQLGRQVL